MNAVEKETILLATIEGCLRDIPPPASEHLARILPLTITLSLDTPSHDLITVDAFRGRAVSVKPGNAVVDFRRVVKFVSALLMDGASAYALHWLILPAAIKAVFDARELLAIELEAPAAAVVLAMHQVEEASEDLTHEHIRQKAVAVLEDWRGADATAPSQVDNALRLLTQIRCIQQANDRYSLNERVILNTPK